jgi:GxxExxY protein
MNTVVEDCVVVELKALDSLSGAHTAQVLNYLKASGLKVGMLFNFGNPKVEMKRLLL